MTMNTNGWNTGLRFDLYAGIAIDHTEFLSGMFCVLRIP